MTLIKEMFDFCLFRFIDKDERNNQHQVVYGLYWMKSCRNLINITSIDLFMERKLSVLSRGGATGGGYEGVPPSCFWKLNDDFHRF